jgi:hypothetical protein
MIYSTNFYCKLETGPAGARLIPYGQPGGLDQPIEMASVPAEWQGWKIIVTMRNSSSSAQPGERTRP